MTILDDPISPVEVEFQIMKLKMDKAYRPDRLSPGVSNCVSCTVVVDHYLNVLNSVYVWHVPYVLAESKGLYDF